MLDFLFLALPFYEGLIYLLPAVFTLPVDSPSGARGLFSDAVFCVGDGIKS
jgi:hypothetical protein